MVTKISEIKDYTHLPYSSTNIPSISLIGSSTARSDRDGRLETIAAEVLFFEDPMSSI